VDVSHLEWIGNYIAEKKPDVIVQIGDFADMHSLSSYDKGKLAGEGARYEEDLESARSAMGLLLGPVKREIRRTRGRWSPSMVLTLGNHEDRITRAIESEPHLAGKLSLADLPYQGWKVVPFLKPITIDGICYAHYFISGSYGRPVTSARALVKKLHMSATMGHTQLCDVYLGDTRADGKSITGLFTGVAYTHDEPYLTPQGNYYRRQIVVKHEVRDGEYDLLFVSLDYLKRRYS
jgi:hypothetical protein